MKTIALLSTKATKKTGASQMPSLLLQGPLIISPSGWLSHIGAQVHSHVYLIASVKEMEIRNIK